MVEGSQVDWSAHNNEPYGLVSDFLAFDKAVAAGLKFAKSNDSTLVIVCPDHGNGGISIGNRQSGSVTPSPYENIEYDNLNIPGSVMKPLQSINWTGRKMARKIIIDSTSYFIDKSYNLRDTLIAHYGLTLPVDSLKTIESIVRSKTYTEDKKRDLTESYLGSRYSQQHFIGWTTTGHTGEDVFLGIFAPDGVRKISGVRENTDIPGYICEVLNLGELQSDQLYFQKVNENSWEFTSFENPKIIGTDLVFEHKSGDSKKRITLPANVNYFFQGKKRINLQTLIVCINKNYYIPQEVVYRLNH